MENQKNNKNVSSVLKIKLKDFFSFWGCATYIICFWLYIILKSFNMTKIANIFGLISITIFFGMHIIVLIFKK